MFELLRTALSTPWGSSMFVISLIGLFVVCSWYLSHFNTKFRSIDKLESNIESIKDSIYKINAWIHVTETLSNPMAKHFSPISLTDKGEQAKNDLGVEDIIVNHWEELKSKALQLLVGTQNPYDVQVVCFELGEKYQEFLTKEELDRVKLYAFKSGDSLGIYGIIFGVLIRNKILELKGLKVSDIDKHDPSKK